MGALIAVLCSGMAFARVLSPAPPSISLSAELFARLFDEAAPARYAADFDLPDAAAESPLGEYALRVAPVDLDDIAVPQAGFAAIPLVRIEALAQSHAAAVPAALPAAVYHGALPPSGDAVVTLRPPAMPEAGVVGLYRGVTHTESMPATVTYRFDLPSTSDQRSFRLGSSLNPSAAFTAGAVGADASSALPHVRAAVSVPMRLGHVRFETHAMAGQVQSNALALRDRSLGEGATFRARLGRQHFGLDLSSQIERLQLNAPSFNASSFDTATNYGTSADHLPLFVPAYADVTKHTFSAGVAVPVSPKLTATVRLDSQHLLGGYGAPGLANLDANNTVYGARVTYKLKGPAAISLSAKHYHFQNNLIPSNAFNQTSATLNLTVKF